MLQQLMDTQKVSALVALNAVLKREDMPYWTQNEHYLETTRAKWLDHYKLTYGMGRSAQEKGASEGRTTADQD